MFFLDWTHLSLPVASQAKLNEAKRATPPTTKHYPPLIILSVEELSAGTEVLLDAFHDGFSATNAIPVQTL